METFRDMEKYFNEEELVANLELRRIRLMNTSFILAILHSHTMCQASLK